MDDEDQGSVQQITQIQSNKEVKTREKKVNSKKLFTYILVLSVVLNIILGIKIINPSFGVVGHATFIDSRIDQNLANNEDPRSYILHYKGLKEILENKILNSSNKENVGIFIQDLKTGAWLGINEKKGFVGASLLKVPIMMAILKKVDLKEMALSDKIVVREEYLDKENPSIEEANTELTIEELLKLMVTKSDNVAKNTLLAQLYIYEIDDLFRHIGIQNPYTSADSNKTVSPRDYSRLFKSLYYSTYLSPEMSEYGIQLTINTQVEDLLSKGVPENVKVAHKFGIYYENVLNDCGIVYHEKNPYVICIMTKDLGSIKSAEVIRQISKETYDFVDKNS